MKETPKRGFKCLLIFLVLVRSADEVVGSNCEEKILASDDNIFSMNQNQNAHPSPILSERTKREEASHDNRFANEDSDNDGEIGTIVKNHTLEIIGLKKELKMLQDELRRLVNQTYEELAPINARYFRDPQENTQLHLAAKRGDEPTVRELIRLGADVNARNKHSETPIIQAAASNSDANATLKIIKYLIENEADVFATDSEGQNFLHKFASRVSPPTPSQFHDLSDYLIGKNLSNLFNRRDELNGSTPFMMAAVNVNLEPGLLWLLLASKVHFTAHDKNGKSVLSYAAEGSHSDKLVTSLLDLGTFNLGKAVVNSDEEMVKLLVRFGADVNETILLLLINPVKSAFGWEWSYSGTPLLLTTDLRNKSVAINIIKILINSGADAYARDQNNETFLHKILRYRQNEYGIEPISQEQFEDIVAFLVSRNLSELFNTRGILQSPNYGPLVTNSTPFQWAIRRWDIETATLTLLKENGVDLNAVDSKGCSVLCYAISMGRTLRFLTDLVNLGANVMSLDATNTSMLHHAANRGNVELVEFFLGKGLDVNAQDSNGDTALKYALYSRNAFKTIRILLRSGANSEIPDKFGSIPRNYYNSNWYADQEKVSNCFSLGLSC